MSKHYKRWWNIYGIRCLFNSMSLSSLTGCKLTVPWKEKKLRNRSFAWERQYDKKTSVALTCERALRGHLKGTSVPGPNPKVPCTLKPKGGCELQCSPWWRREGLGDKLTWKQRVWNNITKENPGGRPLLGKQEPEPESPRTVTGHLAPCSQVHTSCLQRGPAG